MILVEEFQWGLVFTLYFIDVLVLWDRALEYVQAKWRLGLIRYYEWKRNQTFRAFSEAANG